MHENGWGVFTLDWWERLTTVRSMTARSISLGLVATFAPWATAAEPANGFQRLPVGAKIQSSAIAEASGVAFSPTDPGFLWIINDSGSAAEIHLAGTDGSDRGKALIQGAQTIDWEDLAAFKLDGKSYLLVADTGDNKAARERCTFYVIREPNLPPPGKMLNLTLKPAWQVDFRYEDGPRDCESVAVDAAAGKILFLSKRTKPPELYELPLRAAKKSGVQVARKIGQTSVRAPVRLPFGDQPTGMALSADGSQAAVITYVGVFHFPRAATETWIEAFAKPGMMLAPHGLPQAEAVAFAPDGQTLVALSEGKHASIQIYRNAPPAVP
jgi:hypothetical protein